KYPDEYPYLLQTTSRLQTRPDAAGSYDILFARPAASIWLDGNGLHGKGFRPQGDEFLANLQNWHAREKSVASRVSARLPFHGGWFVYLGYELAAQIEPSLHLPPAGDGLPTAFATRCSAALIHD